VYAQWISIDKTLEASVFVMAIRYILTVVIDTQQLIINKHNATMTMMFVMINKDNG
jgi:hypothetical protein